MSRYIVTPPRKDGETSAVERIHEEVPADTLVEAETWVDQHRPGWDLWCKAKRNAWQPTQAESHATGFQEHGNN